MKLRSIKMRIFPIIKMQLLLRWRTEIFILILISVFPATIFGQNIADLLKSDSYTQGFQPYLRIGIYVGVNSAVIEGDAEVFNNKGNVVANIQGRYTISVKNGKIAVSNKLTDGKMIKFVPKFGLIKVGKRMFRGDIDVWVRNGKLIVVNDLNIEDYVRGVINKEIIPSWHIETKKAQAVLARTFAVHQKMFNPRDPLFDLAPTVLDQVYDGLNKEDVTSNQAVDLTKGEVVTVGHNAVKIYFHSTCGGQTGSSQEVWKMTNDHLKSVECPYCKNSKLYRWKRVLKSSFLTGKFKSAGTKVGNVKSISIKKGATRVDSVIVNKQSFPVNKFREIVGFSTIWSNDFTVKKQGSDFVFEGKGAGHGVGACQWGMEGMARKNRNYRQILMHYLTGVEIRKMY
jgi:stage II sporulation protein D